MPSDSRTATFPQYESAHANLSGPDSVAAAGDFGALFPIDRSYTFLNHGSFGSCPHEVLAAQARFRLEIEARPIEMLARKLTPMLRDSATRVARFVGADARRLGFVVNATEAINAVLRSLSWRAGDEVVVVDHVYNAMRQSVRRLADEHGVILREIDVPLPVRSAQDWIDAVVGAFGPRTRLVLIDHVTSPTALVVPVDQIVAEARSRGIFTIVDGAHAPGSIELSIDTIGADAYAANMHKWCCAPKGSGILVVREGLEGAMHPLATSHEYGKGFAAEFDWQGTRDPTAWLATQSAIEFFERFGWPAVRARNHALAAWAQEFLAARWQVEPISPLDGSMLASMAAVPLPTGVEALFPSAAVFQEELYHRERIEIPIIDWKGRWLARVSCHLHTTPAMIERLDEAVRAAISRASRRA